MVKYRNKYSLLGKQRQNNYLGVAFESMECTIILNTENSFLLTELYIGLLARATKKLSPLPFEETHVNK